jgi:hypothetical protein
LYLLFFTKKNWLILQILHCCRVFKKKKKKEKKREGKGREEEMADRSHSVAQAGLEVELVPHLCIPSTGST